MLVSSVEKPLEIFYYRKNIDKKTAKIDKDELYRYKKELDCYVHFFYDLIFKNRLFPKGDLNQGH